MVKWSSINWEMPSGTGSDERRGQFKFTWDASGKSKDGLQVIVVFGDARPLCRLWVTCHHEPSLDVSVTLLNLGDDIRSLVAGITERRCDPSPLIDILCERSPYFALIWGDFIEMLRERYPEALA